MDHSMDRDLRVLVHSQEITALLETWLKKHTTTDIGEQIDAVVMALTEVVGQVVALIPDEHLDSVLDNEIVGPILKRAEVWRQRNH